MKKFFVIMALLPIIANSQVRVASPHQKDDGLKFHYDSTKNALRFADYYIGQDLFVIPSDKVLFFGREIGNLNNSTILKGIPNAEEVNGQTFHVIGKKDYVLGGVKDGFCAYLVMVNKNNGDTLYYEHGIYGEKMFPFIVLGYKDKFERNNKDEEFVFHGYSLYDFDTGDKFDAHSSSWTFKEIIAMPNEKKLGYYLVNDNGRATAVTDMEDFIKKSDIDNYTRKYGKKMVNMALDGEIMIGMPDELVRIAKGNPDKINFSSYGEQWVYKNKHQYIYIKDGKVSSWN